MPPRGFLDTGRASYRRSPLVSSLIAFSLFAGSSAVAQEDSSSFEEIRRFDTEEATQGVAVDARHFYAISNQRIGKYDKRTGEKVGAWEGPRDGPIIHLDSGIVRDGLLLLCSLELPRCANGELDRGIQRGNS